MNAYECYAQLSVYGYHAQLFEYEVKAACSQVTLTITTLTPHLLIYILLRIGKLRIPVVVEHPLNT